MKCTILLHSATDNTRLVARFAVRRLEEAGHRCTLHDVVRQPEPPDLGDVDLLGVACPTNYFNQSRVMARFLERLPRLPQRAEEPRMAFMLATCSGEPGAHFADQAEALDRLGWLILGARAVTFPDNWPPHRALVRPLAFSAPVARLLWAKVRPLRLALSLPYPDIHQPSHRTVARLGRFIDRVARRAAVRDPLAACSPEDLAQERPALFVRLGRSLDMDMIRGTTSIHIHAGRCTRCGSCVKVCPSACITRDDDREIPRVGTTCLGCWACYQHCPSNAIAGWHAPAGRGRYDGPGQELTQLFSARWLD